MASVNKVIIVGNLGRDPEIRYMPSGDAIANIAVATSYRSKDRNTGEQKELTEWHRISFFGRLAEIVGQYLKKVLPSTWKAACRPVSTPTKTASKNTQPTSSLKPCRCWAAVAIPAAWALAWAVATTWATTPRLHARPHVHRQLRHRHHARHRAQRLISPTWTTTSRSDAQFKSVNEKAELVFSSVFFCVAGAGSQPQVVFAAKRDN